MPDMEKVIKGLECCEEFNKLSCDKCPYDYNGRGDGKSECTAELATDALSLLKEQELIRCKDCKWWDKKDGANYGYCHACKHGYHSDHWEIGIYRTYKGDFFCADGERK